ncbi:ABC transporter permease [candidate division KSB1 bacterium]|nr:ABC transporter permease [candidate division KSB1 bacterium]
MKRLIILLIRQFRGRPVTSSINILGLALGMTVVVILAAYCYSELKTDHHFEMGDQIYLVLGEREKTSSIIHAIHTPGILKKHIDEQIPQIQATVRIAGTWDPPIFQVENQEPVTSKLIFADPEFFSIFNYPVVMGNLKNALEEPMSLVLLKSEAIRLFGTVETVGKIVKINNQDILTVTAIIDDPQNNSCLSFNAIAPVSSMDKIQYEDERFTSWQRLNFQTFVRIGNHQQILNLEKAITNLFPVNPFNQEHTTVELFPLQKIYFSEISVSRTDYLRTGDKSQVMILLLVAILVLIIAIINYVNISTAHQFEKLKQYGVQKIIGASQLLIFRNIVFEAIIVFILSTLIAMTITGMIIQHIKNYTGINFSNILFISPQFFGLAFIISIFLGFVAAIFPAVRLAASDPVNNLNKKLSGKENRATLGKILIVFQFAIAITLIAFTILIQKQIKFGSKDLGFEKENIVAIKLTDQLRNRRDVLKKYLLEQSLVGKVSFSRFYPGKDFSSWQATLMQNGEEKVVTFDNFHSDAEFFDLMGIRLLKGRLFSSDLATDRNKILVNEAFVREYGILNPIGATFYDCEFEIIGVIKDFHFKPVNIPISPLAIISREWASECLVKLNNNNFEAIQAFLKNTHRICSELSPAFPVEINFLDTAVENMYQHEIQFRRIFSLFAGTAIFLCCLGIFALSLIACQRRTKEIGIRKVIGANSFEILMLMNKNLFRWVGISFIIACPVAWYVMNRWLENFAYKTELSWWIFLLAGIITTTIALLTVSWQTIRAATANPVESLRYE